MTEEDCQRLQATAQVPRSTTQHHSAPLKNHNIPWHLKDDEGVASAKAGGNLGALLALATKIGNCKEGCA